MEEDTNVSRGLSTMKDNGVRDRMKFSTISSLQPEGRQPARQRPSRDSGRRHNAWLQHSSLTGQSEVFLGASWLEYRGYCLTNTKEIMVDDQEAE